jgi:hypothetical protein
MKRGHCVECNQAYESPEIEDGLCPQCLTLERQNDPGPYADTPPWKYSKAAMRERLGVSGDRDE